jgi:hypothetical protein
MNEFTNQKAINITGEIIITNPNMSGLHAWAGYAEQPKYGKGFNFEPGVQGGLYLRTGRIYRVKPSPTLPPVDSTFPDGPWPAPYNTEPGTYTQGEIPWLLAASLVAGLDAAWVKPDDKPSERTPVDDPDIVPTDSTKAWNDDQIFPSATFLPAGETQWYTRCIKVDTARTLDTWRDLHISHILEGHDVGSARGTIEEHIVVSDRHFTDLLKQFQRATDTQGRQQAVNIDAPDPLPQYAFRDRHIDTTIQWPDIIRIYRVKIDFDALPDRPYEFISTLETIKLEARLWRRDKDVMFRLGDRVFALDSNRKGHDLIPAEHRSAIWQAINQRNQEAGLEEPQAAFKTCSVADLRDNLTGRHVFEILGVTPPNYWPDFGNAKERSTQLPDIIKDNVYPRYTGQEWNAYEAGFTRPYSEWHANDQDGAIYLQTKNHFLRLQGDLTAETISWTQPLEHLVDQQDFDGVFALMYVASLLAPISAAQPNVYVPLWIDLDDVAKKIGSDPRSTKDREDERRRIYAYLRFAHEAQITGKRTLRLPGQKYRDTVTGETIETSVNTPMIRIMREERPLQTALFGETPRRIEIVLGREWLRLLTDPSIAQFMPCGEILGGIPRGKPAGSWARVIGYNLLDFWRRNICKDIKPPRRELLDPAPKQSPPSEILNSTNPRRACMYWKDALIILADEGLVARVGEIGRTPEEQTNGKRQSWKEEWLDECVDIRPGPKVKASLDATVKHKYVSKPKNLAAPRNKGGRPRKKPVSA